MKKPSRKNTQKLTRRLIAIPILELAGLALLAGLIVRCAATETASAEVSDAPETVQTAFGGEFAVKTGMKKAFSVTRTKDGVLVYSSIDEKDAETLLAEASIEHLEARARTDAELSAFTCGGEIGIGLNPDAVLLAKLLYGESRGIPSEAEKAAVCWCVMNRTEDERFPNTVAQVVRQSGQFDGFDERNPVQSNLYLIALDVLNRYTAEVREGISEGRVLPRGYCYFLGDDTHNFFYTDTTFADPWTWLVPDPYPAIRENRTKHYTPSDDELDMIARTIWGVSRGQRNDMECRAVVWCILNRVASPLFPDTVYEVITEAEQFPAYLSSNPILSDNLAIAREVVNKWKAEQSGVLDVGRVLPANYIYFNGNGSVNFFSKSTPVTYGLVYINDKAYLKAFY